MVKYSLNKIHEDTIKEIQKEYKANDDKWIIGYSGGKDSSALLKLVYLSILGLKKRNKPIHVFYCDTGVEIPTIRDYAHKVLQNLSQESTKDNIPIKIDIVYPDLKDRFFTNIIGRGYPPPTNKFRWCTNRLRINPAKTLTSVNPNENQIVLLGIRNGESLQRDRIIYKHKAEKSHYFRQEGRKNAVIFNPILHYDVQDVWDILFNNLPPESIDTNELGKLYKVSELNECNKIRYSFEKRRFGCWACSVVRKDKAMEGLIFQGYGELKPLFDFRNWLVKIRDRSDFRHHKRRDGSRGLGPFNLKARRLILRKLLQTQSRVKWDLISDQEVKYIRDLWKNDQLEIKG